MQETAKGIVFVFWSLQLVQYYLGEIRDGQVLTVIGVCPKKGIVPGMHSLEIGASKNLFFLNGSFHVEAVFGKNDEIWTLVGMRAVIDLLGIKNISNLILQFPGSDVQDVAETLNVLEFAKPFYPLKAVNFWLGLGSPVWQNPKKYGIKAVFNHPNWSRIFPAEIYRTLPFMILSYRADRVYQKKIWKPVQKNILEWQKQYAEHLGKSVKLR